MGFEPTSILNNITNSFTGIVILTNVVFKLVENKNNIFVEKRFN